MASAAENTGAFFAGHLGALVEWMGQGRAVPLGNGGGDAVPRGQGAAEKARIVRLRLEEVVYDGQSGEATLSFYPLGIQRLANEARAAGAAPAEARA